MDKKPQPTTKRRTAPSKPPAIRQTKTSIFRMVKANPLLIVGDEETKAQGKEIGVDRVKLPESVFFAPSTCYKDVKTTKPPPLVRSQSVRAPKLTERKPKTQNRKRSVSAETLKPNAEKRSVTFKASTPRTPTFHKYRATPFKMSPETEGSDLRKHLNDWLFKHNKSKYEFFHLKDFASDADGFDVENKENIENYRIHKTSSYEDLHIQGCKPADKYEYDLKDRAHTALSDLRNLVLDGYPCIRSEEWLELIHDRYPEIEREPEYWECRAFIEQSRDNITAAVEHYRTAIVHGAQVESVDRSLEELLEKFSLFNIGTNQRSNNKKQAKIVSDARDIFKSCIIRVAVHERDLKKQQEKLPDVLSTPVHSNMQVRKS